MVPTIDPDQVATPFSHLFQELCLTPEAVFRPLAKLNAACGEMAGSATASNVPIILFMARLSGRILGFARYVHLSHQGKQSTNMRWTGVYRNGLDKALKPGIPPKAVK